MNIFATTYESQGTTELIETTKTHKDICYSQVEAVFTFTQTGNKKTTSKYYECNCSVFKTEKEVKAFIDEVFFQPAI